MADPLIIVRQQNMMAVGGVECWDTIMGSVCSAHGVVRGRRSMCTAATFDVIMAGSSTKLTTCTASGANRELAGAEMEHTWDIRLFLRAGGK